MSDRHFHHKLQLGFVRAHSKLDFDAVQDEVSNWLDVFLEFSWLLDISLMESNFMIYPILQGIP